MSRQTDDVRTLSGLLVKGFDRAKAEDAIYVERLAWKFGGKVAHNAKCLVCGDAYRDHERPALFCPTANRLPDIPEVPAALDALVFRPLTYTPRRKRPAYSIGVDYANARDDVSVTVEYNAQGQIKRVRRAA